VTHALPDSDLRALFAVLLAVHGSLYVDELPDDMFDRLSGRLAKDELLARGATKGQVNALLADLAQRMHWAMSPDPDAPYPAPRPREVIHDFAFPAGESSARAFLADAVALGGRRPWPRPDRTRWTTGPDGQRQPMDPPEVWLAGVVFAELPPDAAFRARETQLIEVASRHGGHSAGHYA
jgi:hypothetical protein